MMTERSAVVVGSSVAGVRAAQALADAGFDGSVTVIGGEDVEPYDKPPLSKGLLAGSKSVPDISLLGPEGWGQVVPRLGVPAMSLDVAARAVRLTDGETIPFDVAVIATGARPRTLCDPSARVVTVRELRDVTRLRSCIQPGATVLVVGSGFIGAEIASTARILGAEVTILEAADEPFAGGLGSEVGALVHALHWEHGVKVRSGATVRSVTEQDAAARVVLDDGRVLEADIAVVGVGVLPNTEWLEGSRLTLSAGVVTDAYLAAGPDVYAIGDVARWEDVRTGVHRRVEHWTAAVEQAATAAHNIVNPKQPRTHDKAPYFWTDQHGITIQVVGWVSPSDRVELLQCGTPLGERTVALYTRDNRFQAGVALGWPRAAVALRQAWERNATRTDAETALRRLTDEIRPITPKVLT